MDGTTLFLGHFGMGRFCTWAVFVWAVFACGPFWDGPFSFGMTWYLGRLHLKAERYQVNSAHKRKRPSEIVPTIVFQ